MKRNGKIKAGALLLAACLLSGCIVEGKSPDTVGRQSGSGTDQLKVPQVMEKLDKAIAKNSDVVAWLTLPNTTVDEAVVQAKDNEYYLRRDVERKYAYEGCYYMDFESVMFNDGKDLATNTIIYGHNLGKPIGVKDDPNGVKFAQLLKLNQEETAKKTPYVYLTTKGETHIFQIFAAFYCESFTKPVSYHHAEYSTQQMEALTADARARSTYLYDVTVTGDDKLLTLSTGTYRYGTYSQNPDQRFVVMARLVTEGEALSPEAKISPNPSPKEPSFVHP